MITAINMHCPYCREVIRVTEPGTSGTLLSKHIVDKHKDIADKLGKEEKA